MRTKPIPRASRHNSLYYFLGSNASPTLAFTALEIHLLDQLTKDKGTRRPQMKSISSYLIRIARLAGYLARAGDSPPGNTVLWRGMSRLTDIELGFVMGAELVGN